MFWAMTFIPAVREHLTRPLTLSLPAPRPRFRAEMVPSMAERLLVFSRLISLQPRFSLSRAARSDLRSILSTAFFLSSLTRHFLLKGHCLQSAREKWAVRIPFSSLQLVL